MIHSPTRRALLAVVAASTLFASALASGVAFDDAAFDPFDDEEGFVDIVRDGDLLTVTFSTDEGSIPASMTSDFLPLDEDDFDEELLTRKDSLARYAGLPFATTRTTVMVVVDGDPVDIMKAVLSRLAAQGIVYVEDFPGGPVHSYLLAAGEARWRIAMSVTPEGTIVHLQAFVHTDPWERP